MSKKGGNPEYLVPLNKRSKNEQSKIQAMGGKKSGEVRKEKRLMSMVLADYIAKNHDVILRDENGQEISRETMTTDQLIDYSLTHVLARADSSSVAGIRAMAELTEGSKVAMTVEDRTPFMFVDPPKKVEE
jgi:hypothetical protein